MLATSEPIFTPSGYWRLIPARYSGLPCYYHEGCDELAFEDIQEARLVKLPATAEITIRTELGLRKENPPPSDDFDAEFRRIFG